jgi:hypothetical protein
LEGSESSGKAVTVTSDCHQASQGEKWNRFTQEGKPVTAEEAHPNPQKTEAVAQEQERRAGLGFFKIITSRAGAFLYLLFGESPAY